MNSATSVAQHVREILHEIGALTDRPEKGWKKKVEEKLVAKGIDISKVNIYAIRNKELQNKEPVHKDFNDFASCAVFLKELNSFAKKVGGLDKVEQMIEILKSCQN